MLYREIAVERFVREKLIVPVHGSHGSFVQRVICIKDHCISRVYAIYLSLVCLVHAVGEERSEIRTARRHDGAMNREMSVFDANHRIAQLSVLAQVV